MRHLLKYVQQIELLCTSLARSIENGEPALKLAVQLRTNVDLLCIELQPNKLKAHREAMRAEIPPHPWAYSNYTVHNPKTGEVSYMNTPYKPQYSDET